MDADPAIRRQARLPFAAPLEFLLEGAEGGGKLDVGFEPVPHLVAEGLLFGGQREIHEPILPVSGYGEDIGDDTIAIRLPRSSPPPAP